MQLIGRNATDKEMARMASPFNVNHGEEWTPEKIRDCIQKGAETATQNPELQQALEEGVTLLAADMAEAN